MASEIKPGDRLIVTDASGHLHPAHAASGIQRGRDFMVVWACFCSEAECDGDMAMPWPADSVKREAAS